MLARLSIALLVSAAFLYGWGLWEELGPRKIAVWQGLLASIAWMIFVFAAFISMFHVWTTFIAPVIWPQPDSWPSTIANLAACVLAAWAASIATQIIKNLALITLGKTTQKLEWVRKSPRKRKKTAGGRRTVH
jgi:hypothetical protein